MCSNGPPPQCLPQQSTLEPCLQQLHAVDEDQHDVDLFVVVADVTTTRQSDVETARANHNAEHGVEDHA